jgi:heme iron utilization protein
VGADYGICLLFLNFEFLNMSQLETAIAAYQNFTDLFQSLVISTVSADHIPNASYAPFVIDESRSIYIYVSGLSTHTQNLHAIPKASVLFIEDESQTQQIFARRRLTFECTATLIERETELWNQILSRFEARFGDIIQILRDLPDFRIFKLTPNQGRFVIGFGAAYEVDPNDFSLNKKKPHI